MLRIGTLELELAEPEKLDEQLIAATGCPAREVREHLTGAAVAGFVASALRPFLKEAPAPIDLANAIAGAGVLRVRAQVQALYDKHLGIEPPAMPDHLKPKEARRGRQAKA